MSGSDRSRGGGRGSGSGSEWSCVSLARRVTLNSPAPAIVSTLQNGDVLALVLVPSSSGGIGRIEAQTTTGASISATAGSITFDGVRRLWDCMERGYRYLATVDGVPSGGRSVVGFVICQRLCYPRTTQSRNLLYTRTGMRPVPIWLDANHGGAQHSRILPRTPLEAVVRLRRARAGGHRSADQHAGLYDMLQCRTSVGAQPSLPSLRACRPELGLNR